MAFPFLLINITILLGVFSSSVPVHGSDAVLGMLESGQVITRTHVGQRSQVPAAVLRGHSRRQTALTILQRC